MLPRRKVELSEKQESELREGYLHGKNPVFRMHCQGLLLSNQGKTVQEIMEILEIGSRNTIYDWFNRWKAEGIDGLHIRPGRGRTPKIPIGNKDLIARVKDLVEKEGQKLSYIKAELEELLGEKLNDETVRLFLKSLVTHGVASVKACVSSETKKTTKKKFDGLQNSENSIETGL